VYRLCEEILTNDWRRRNQLEEAVRGPGAHIAEGFGRFSPPDFARFVVMARASLMESQNHLIDLVDRKYIAQERRAALDQLAIAALAEVTGLLEYLQSPEALRNARRAREQRLATRDQRRTPGHRARDAVSERGHFDVEPRTQPSEPRTQPSEPGTEPEHERGTGNAEE
jgi:four helix bundle protein